RGFQLHVGPAGPRRPVAAPVSSTLGPPPTPTREGPRVAGDGRDPQAAAVDSEARRQPRWGLPGARVASRVTALGAFAATGQDPERMRRAQDAPAHPPPRSPRSAFSGHGRSPGQASASQAPRAPPAPALPLGLGMSRASSPTTGRSAGSQPPPRPQDAQ
ncbi:hypothetical protein P7K49_027892, partial [Saguinus oedipus]